MIAQVKCTFGIYQIRLELIRTEIPKVTFT